MARPTTPSYVELFGGLNQESGSEIGQNEARELINLYIENRGQELQRRKGTAILRDWDEDGIINGLEWVRIDTTDYLIAALNGDLYDAFAGTDVVSGGADRFPSWSTVNGAVINKHLYLGNGVDPNVRWDGTSIKQVTPSAVASGMVAVTGNVATLSGTFQYKVTFLSADGIDGEPSEAVSVVTTSHSVSLSAIPTASGSEDITGRRIWRTTANGATFYLLTTIADNTTTTYTDTTEDADLDLTTELDTSAVAFPPCRYLVNHQERLVGAGSDGDEQTVFISNYQVPELCPLVAPLDEVDDPVFGGRIPVEDTVTGLASFGNVLLVFTAGGCWRLTGDNPNNWSFDRWIDNGCLAHRSIASHRNMLIWLGSDGVYLAEGWGQVSHVSDPIREDLGEHLPTYLAQAHGFIWKERYYLCSVNFAFYFDLRYRVWGELENWSWWVSTVSRSTPDERERIFATDDLTEQVWELETGTDDDGEEISVRWESKDKDMGHFGRDKRIHRVIVAFKAGTGEATVELYRSGELLDTFTHDLATVRRTGSEISVLDDRASEGARDEYFRLSVTADSSSEDFRILRAGLHYTLCT